MKEFTIKKVPFDWDDNMSEIALEDFKMIQKTLPYCTCQTIGMALAKLEMLEKQGCKIIQQNKDIVEQEYMSELCKGCSNICSSCMVWKEHNGIGVD